jgi:integrase
MTDFDEFYCKFLANEITTKSKKIMASVKFYLDKRSKKQDGTYPLKLTVTHKKAFHISLGVSVPEENWVSDRIEGNFKNRVSTNSYLRARFSAVENLLRTLALVGKLDQISPEQLKNLIENLNSSENIPAVIQVESSGISNLPGAALLFAEHAKTCIATRETEGTREVYAYTMNMLRKNFDLSKLTFGDIDYSWLCDLRLKLAPTCNKNSQSIHFRNIRAIYKDANKRKLVSKDLYPFDGFEIGNEETMHRDLSLQELRTLLYYPVEPYQECYRDLFMLQFYLIGINLTDILHASEIRDGRLTFRRAKTHKIYNIKVPPEAMAIIEKYSPGKNYLLNFLDNYKNPKDFTSRYNRNLKQIGAWKWIDTVSKKGRPIKKKRIEPLLPFLTSYYSRHTWATFAAELDIPEKTISMALGHGKKTVTDIYINYNLKKVDQANQMVIDYLHGRISAPTFDTSAGNHHPAIAPAPPQGYVQPPAEP